MFLLMVYRSIWSFRNNIFVRNERRMVYVWYLEGEFLFIVSKTIISNLSQEESSSVIYILVPALFKIIPKCNVKVIVKVCIDDLKSIKSPLILQQKPIFMLMKLKKDFQYLILTLSEIPTTNTILNKALVFRIIYPFNQNKLLLSKNPKDKKNKNIPIFVPNKALTILMKSLCWDVYYPFHVSS